jgi:hypothetical protein
MVKLKMKRAGKLQAASDIALESRCRRFRGGWDSCSSIKSVEGCVVSNHSGNWSRRGTGDQSGCNEQDISQAYFRPCFEIGAVMDILRALCHDLYQTVSVSSLSAERRIASKVALREFLSHVWTAIT